MAGIALGIIWWRLIVNYEKSYSTKLEIIREVEKKLPFAPYIGEQIAGDQQVENGSPHYVQYLVTWAEKLLPIMFIALYAIVAARVLWSP